MILLDTNVVSELMRGAPDPRVDRWVANQPMAALFLSAISEAELRYGAALLPSGRRRAEISTALEAMLDEEFRGRILPFDSAAAICFADLAADRRRAGRPIPQADGQIAAIARSRGAMLATRNTVDFEACGVDLINPWETLP